MLELKNVSFEVSDEKAQKEIIRGINLKIDDNKFVVITGPNGGGKSTLAKLIVGIEKPTSGQILFNGEDITEKSITERAKGYQLCFSAAGTIQRNPGAGSDPYGSRSKNECGRCLSVSVRSRTLCKGLYQP